MRLRDLRPETEEARGGCPKVFIENVSCNTTACNCAISPCVRSTLHPDWRLDRSGPASASSIQRFRVLTVLLEKSSDEDIVLTCSTWNRPSRPELVEDGFLDSVECNDAQIVQLQGDMD